MATNDLNIAFNRVAHHLIEQALFDENFGRSFRCEGKVKINRKNYNATMQHGLIVVAGAPTIPDKVEVRT